MCGSQTLEQEAVKSKLLWRPHEVRDARAVGYLPEESCEQEVEPAQEKELCCSQLS